jgi:molecular chaperone Hsp33
MADEILRTLIRQRTLRVVVATTTELSREAARRQGAGRDAAVAMSRAATSALLVATLTKGDERVTLQIAGGGPLGDVIADARSSGDVRVTVGDPAATATRLGDAVGRRGVLSVIRDLGLKERYQGQSPLVTGEIDEDVEHYLRASEQIPSALGCDVAVDGGGAIVAAAGILVQALPDAGAAAEALLRECQHRLRTGGLRAAPGADPVALARSIVGEGEDIELLDRRPLRFFCPCSLERVADMLATLGPSELEHMIAEGNPAEIHCNFCRQRYEVPLDRLRAIAAAAAAGPRGSA